MGWADRVRALPRWSYAVAAGTAAVLVVLIAVLVAAGGDDGDGGSVAVGAATSAPTGSGPVPTTGVVTETTMAVTSPEVTDAVTSTTGPRVRPVEEYELDVDEDDPAVVARPIPTEPADTTPPSTIAPPPWAASTRTTASGHVGVDVGCAADLGYQSLDRFFAERVGPALGWDYQHVYPLGGDRYLWLFQDTFIDHAGVVGNLGNARFVHNAAMLQQGRCFTLLHRGTSNKPAPFEEGDGPARCSPRGTGRWAAS